METHGRSGRRRAALAVAVGVAHAAVLAWAAGGAERGLPGERPAPTLSVLLRPRVAPQDQARVLAPVLAARRTGDGSPRSPGPAPAVALPTADVSTDPVDAAPAGRPAYEAWELDVPPGFAYPPAGLDEVLEARTRPALLRVALGIDEAGRLQEIRIEREHGLSESEREAILAALRAARFEPGRLGGRAVASIKRIEMRHGGEVFLEAVTTLSGARHLSGSAVSDTPDLQE